MMASQEPPRYVASDSVAACEFGDDLAILDLKSNIYYSLNPVGVFIWELLQEPRSFEEIADAVVGAFDVERARGESDVSSLVTSLRNAGLVQVDDGAVAA